MQIDSSHSFIFVTAHCTHAFPRDIFFSLAPSLTLSLTHAVNLSHSCSLVTIHFTYAFAKEISSLTHSFCHLFTQSYSLTHVVTLIPSIPHIHLFLSLSISLTHPVQTFPSSFTHSLTHSLTQSLFPFTTYYSRLSWSILLPVSIYDSRRMRVIHLDIHSLSYYLRHSSL